MSLMVAHEVPTSTTMALPHGPTGVAEARRKLRTDLRRRHVPEPVIDDAVLIVSELLSNSCRHARPLGADGDPGYGERGYGERGYGAVGYGDLGRRAGLARGGGRENGDGVRADRENSDTGDGRAGPACAPAPVDRPPGPWTAHEAGIRASWSVGEDGLLVLEVTDGGGPTRPRPASPSLTAHGGRGLGIVGSLALRWGVRDAPGEVTVWALLPVRGRPARRDESPTPALTLTPAPAIGLPAGLPLDLPLDLAESLDDAS